MYEFALYDNPVTPDPNDRIAVVQTQKTYTLDDIFRLATNRGSTVTIAEGKSVFEEINYSIEQLLTEGGGTITTPLFNLTVRIIGVFNGDDDNFDPLRHQVKIRLTPGVRLRDMEKKIKVRKVAYEKARPVIQHVFDHTSESQDEVITPGGGMRITGSQLKFDQNIAIQGIFFISESGKETRVQGSLLKNKPGELIFIVPSTLTQGSYSVEVRTVFKNSKELRKGSLEYDLSVG